MTRHLFYLADTVLQRYRAVLKDIKVHVKISYLEEQWREIQQLYLQLSYEPYIDDQLKIDEGWEISEDLVKYLNENDEKQALMKEIATLIEENDYYDEYGCYDPMEMLYNALKKGTMT